MRKLLHLRCQVAHLLGDLGEELLVTGSLELVDESVDLGKLEDVGMEQAFWWLSRRGVLSGGLRHYGGKIQSTPLSGASSRCF